MRFIVPIAVLLCLAGHAQAKTFRDAGFEKPKLAAGVTFSTPTVGTKFGPWLIIGPQGASMLVLTRDYTENNGTLFFKPHGGRQSLDLTGPSNQGAIGVQQAVKTTPGTGYTITFWLANQDDAQSNYPLPSSATVFINGAAVQTFTTDANTANNVTWQQFSLAFTATGRNTTVAFVNATPTADNYCGLDDVSIAPSTEIRNR